MARVVKLVSDITGTEANESEFVKLIVRSHPASEEPKQLDILPGETDGLKAADNLVVVELDGEQIVVTHAEFRKLIPDDTVKDAPGTRGRRKGFSPKAS